MILMIYINDSNIFILIYPCYISILLYRLYNTMLCILLLLLHLCLVYIFCVCLCTFIMIYRHEHIYSIYLPILSMLLSLHTFYSFYAALLLYDTHSFCELTWLWCFPLPHTHVSTYTHILYSLYICFHVP